MINAHFTLIPTEDGDLVEIREVFPPDQRFPFETLSYEPVDVHLVPDGRAFIAAEAAALEYMSVPLEQRWSEDPYPGWGCN